MSTHKKRVKDPRDYQQLGGGRGGERVMQRSSRKKTRTRGIQCYRKSVRRPGKEPLVWASKRLVLNIISTFSL